MYKKIIVNRHVIKHILILSTPNLNFITFSTWGCLGLWNSHMPYASNFQLTGVNYNLQDYTWFMPIIIINAPIDQKSPLIKKRKKEKRNHRVISLDILISMLEWIPFCFQEHSLVSIIRPILAFTSRPIWYNFL